MPINRWWDGRPDEIFWLESTGRDDLGVDLNAPQSGEEGQDVWSYTLVTYVSEGDIVVHYRVRPRFEITAWSRAVGAPYEDDVLWGAQGVASGRGPVAPYWRPGWRIGLEGPFALSVPVTLERLRELTEPIAGVKHELEGAVAGTAYFPFMVRSDGLRGAQAYLTKLPRALLDVIPELSGLPATVAEAEPRPDAPAPRAAEPVLGTDYVDEDENWETSEREPFAVDPAVVDRGIRGHKHTQNSLAAYLRERELTPRRAVAGEPQFDLAWEENGVIYVAEVKSRTDRNEERQLRLALGQILRYAHQLRPKEKPVRPVIVLEAEPRDMSWVELCAELGVVLVWPDSLGSQGGPDPLRQC
jgi:hypothetical protein